LKNAAGAEGGNTVKNLSFSSLKTKNVKYGGYAAIITIAVLIGLIVINLIIQQFPTEIDLTEKKLYSLTDQTEKVLDNLKNEVIIYALYAPGNEAEEILAVLRRYENKSDKVRIEFIDPDKNPAFLAKYDPEGSGISQGSLIVEAGENFKVITPFDLYDISYGQNGQPQITGLSAEPRVTSAILYVTSGYTPVIYELTGHGEAVLANYGVTDMLEKENYSLKSLDLVTTPSIPEDADVLSVISPKFDCTEAEAEKIITFIEEGGRAMFFFDFLSFDFFPVFGSILRSFGVEILPGIVMEGDPKQMFSTELPNYISPKVSRHEILLPLIENNIPMLLPNTQAIKILDMKKREIEVTPILTTSDNSWLRNVQDGTPVRISSDVPGPLNTGVVITRKQLEADAPESYRVLVCGTSGFLAPIPPFGQLKGNMEFLMNGLSWVNSRSETISIRSKSMFKMPMNMSAVQVVIYAGIVILIIPLVIFIIGLVIWLKRRHL